MADQTAKRHCSRSEAVFFSAAGRPVVPPTWTIFAPPFPHRGDLVTSVFNQLFQDHLNRHILPPAHYIFPMVVSQPHGMPEWEAPARGSPKRGLRLEPKANFHTEWQSKPPTIRRMSHPKAAIMLKTLRAWSGRTYLNKKPEEIYLQFIVFPIVVHVIGGRG